ncbi:MAG: PepSY domain-containing protein, partial [Undibacterium sp.]|nr:PepSY domain-containing protein [Undibacterium sp.]
MNFRLSIIAASLALTYAGTSMAANERQLFNVAPDAKMTAPVGLTTTLAKQQGLSKDHALKVASVNPGQDGNKIVRTVQTFKGVRVWGSGAVAVVDSKDQLLSTTTGKPMKAAPLLSAAPVSGKAKFDAINAQARVRSTTPKISADAAIAKALGNTTADLVTLEAPTTELIIFPISVSRLTAEGALKNEASWNAVDFETVVTDYKLAYLVKTNVTVGGKLEIWNSIVDANTGDIIKRISGIHDV